MRAYPVELRRGTRRIAAMRAYTYTTLDGITHRVGDIEPVDPCTCGDCRSLGCDPACPLPTCDGAHVPEWVRRAQSGTLVGKDYTRS